MAHVWRSCWTTSTASGTTNRLENLRILCPNCNATLDTHCGRKNKRERAERSCDNCGERFWPQKRTQRFCSRRCVVRSNAPRMRRVERPPYGQLVAELEASSFLAVGRKYGVSDNAIRKWLRAYESERPRDEDAREAA